MADRKIIRKSSINPKRPKLDIQSYSYKSVIAKTKFKSKSNQRFSIVSKLDQLDNEHNNHQASTISIQTLKKNRNKPCWVYFCIGNCFCCDGCQWKPSYKREGMYQNPFKKQLVNSIYFYFTISLLTLIDGLFLFFEFNFLCKYVTVVAAIISQVLFVVTLVTLVITACTDPGIIPPAEDCEASILKYNLKIPYWSYNSGQPPPLRTQEIMIYGQPVRLKYCYTCRFFRPPRTSHCSICNNCVDRFDHHCQWIGNCVGRRNYRTFYLFLISLSSYGVFLSACELTHLIMVKRGIDNSNIFGTTILLVINLISIWSVLGLTGFHTYLVLSNLTTNEDIKDTFVSKRIGHGDWLENPFTTGSAWLNCKLVLCASRPPTLLQYYDL